jgi:hypothetical protein
VLLHCSHGHASEKRKAENIAAGFWYNYREAKEFLLKEFNACERCGWDKDTRILELHHKDCDRKNNHRSNLALLCPNCHTLEHFIGGTGQFKNNKGRKQIKDD